MYIDGEVKQYEVVTGDTGMDTGCITLYNVTYLMYNLMMPVIGCQRKVNVLQRNLHSVFLCFIGKCQWPRRRMKASSW